MSSKSTYTPSFQPVSYSHQPTAVPVTDDGNNYVWLRNAVAAQVGTVNGIYPDMNVFYALCWINLAVSGAILIHSFLLHGKKFSSVRIQTDLAAIANIASVVAAIEALKHPTREYWALLFDFCYNGIFNVIIQLCDNYMFYFRMLAVAKLPLWHRILINVYIWLVLTCTWLPAQTIIPFFYNCNTDEFNTYFPITLAIDSWGNVAYNFYFTFHFLYILYKLFGPSVGINTTGSATIGTPHAAGGGGGGGGVMPQMPAPGGFIPTHEPRSPLSVLMNYQITKIIAVKSIGHCITASLAVLTLSYLPGINNLCYNLIIVVGMHFWFNYTNDKFFYFKSEAQEDRWRRLSDLSSTQGFTQVKPVRQSWIDWLLGKEPIVPEEGIVVEGLVEEPVQEPGRNARQELLRMLALSGGKKQTREEILRMMEEGEAAVAGRGGGGGLGGGGGGENRPREVGVEMVVPGREDIRMPVDTR